MPNIKTLTDADWREVVADQPALLLVSNGENLRGDFSTAFKKASDEHQQFVFGQIDPTQNPAVAETFRAGEKPLLIGYYQGEALVRKQKPWGSDVVLAIDLLKQRQRDNAPAQPTDATTATTDRTNQQETSMPTGEPIHVTDDTFQKEAIDHSANQPVLIDFWAPWCGPCKQVAPILDKLAAEFDGQVRIVKVNTDENPGLQQYFRIMSIPTIMAIKNQTIVFNQPGALPEPSLRDLIQQLIDLDVPPPEAQAEANGQPNETEPGQD